MHRKSFVACMLAGALAWTGAAAQGYPERPVTLVLGFAAGGPAGTAARIVADELSKKLGQPVIVKNEVGAVGTIAASSVARAAPDGYTLLVGAQSSIAIAPNTLESIPFDPLTSFAPISATIFSPWLLMASPTIPVRNLAELVEYAKARPGQLNYGSIGRGGSHNFVSELFKQAAGIDVKHVPYKGSSDAYVALIRGDIHFYFDTMPSPLSLVNDGRARAIAVTGTRRMAVLPNVPTFAELGLGQLDTASWFGLLAPARTPPAIVARLNRDVVAALSDPNVQESLSKMGLYSGTSSSAEFSAFLGREVSRWKGIVESTGFKKE